MKSLSEYCKIKSSPENTSEIIHVCFSCTNASLIEGKSDKSGSMINFSSNNDPSDDELLEFCNFSLINKIKEDKKPIKEIIRRRIREIINYINSKPAATSVEDRDSIIDYLSSFLYRNINRFISRLNDGEPLNIAIALGITPYLTNKKLINELKQVLVIIARQLKAKGYIQVNYQNKLQTAYNKLFFDLLQTIENTYIRPEKRGILVPSNDPVESNHGTQIKTVT